MLHVLAEAGADCSSVTSVDLSNRGLQALPLWLARCAKLTHLKLDGNPLTTVPQPVLQGGVAAALQHASDTEVGGRVRWTKAKVAVLGKRGVGKSHMVFRLRAALSSSLGSSSPSLARSTGAIKMERSPSYQGLGATNGVDICEFALGSSADLVCFDFGGDEVFYPTHHFFLGPRCVLLLVWRLDDRASQEHVLHWLAVATQLARDSRSAMRLVVVATHADAVPGRADQVRSPLSSLVAGVGKLTVCASTTTRRRRGLD